MIIFTDGISLEGNLIDRLRECIDKYSPSEIVLREKHLNDADYEQLAIQLMHLVADRDIKIWINGRPDIASRLSLPLHIGINAFTSMKSSEIFGEISVSAHSVDEAMMAERLGATRVVVGHIFDTACKANTPARGLEFLENICSKVSVPVVAIGGINRMNSMSVLNAGASDICIMSSAMTLEF